MFRPSSSDCRGPVTAAAMITTRGCRKHRWRAEHESAVVLTLDDAFELGRLASRACFGTY